ncbi:MULTISPECIES: arsenic transporter [unclassified Bacillus (in: firmicutes)]|uniref:arsenic transporter n=1 Tax=unclassified Bacillus (in: firmicutes) TaxID=185979 RepID=UPI000B8072D1|nr:MULTISPECIES: arsenic transporter [unclassified Bacillus (in: firmicutes)]
MLNLQSTITILTFLVTMLIIFWRPKGMNEAIPATVGAMIVILSGAVSFTDLGDVSSKIIDAAITIMATIVMAIVLESFGFFHWCAVQLAKKAKNSGIRLFWYTNLLCFLMTLFFNNDGSILITTPILLLLLHHLRLTHNQKIPYLVSGALIATASSVPIGVSNIVNLIALKIVHMDLYMHTAMMFVPATLGLLFMASLLFLIYQKQLPKTLPFLPIHLDENFVKKSFHPLQPRSEVAENRKRTRFMFRILLFVLCVRISLFIASYFQFSIAITAVIGSIILLGWRWYKLRIPPIDMIKKTPWYVLVFAFSMYVIVYGLHNIGLTELLVTKLHPLITSSLFHANFIMGGLISVLSNIFNNHPALMIGTITLTEMGLDPITLKTIYLANIIGSDMGSLLLPIGTLATLMWMFITRKGKVNISWGTYMKATFLVIPPTVIFTLFCLYYWVTFILH